MRRPRVKLARSWLGHLPPIVARIVQVMGRRNAIHMLQRSIGVADDEGADFSGRTVGYGFD